MRIRGDIMTDKVNEYLESLKGKKVAFVGMGVANVPCAKWLAAHGVQVYACDRRDREYIGEDICNDLDRLGVIFSLGENYLDVLPQIWCSAHTAYFLFRISG